MTKIHHATLSNDYWRFYRDRSVFPPYPSFCTDAVNEKFPTTKNADQVLVEVSRLAFKGSQRYLFSGGYFYRDADFHTIATGTCVWLRSLGFQSASYVYIKFSPITTP